MIRWSTVDLPVTRRRNRIRHHNEARRKTATRDVRAVVCLLLTLIAAVAAGCRADAEAGRAGGQQEDEPLAVERAALLRELRDQGIESDAVLEALDRVPRERFVPHGVRHLAYANHPLPIGYDQTISQPYIVALMTELIDPQPTDRVLEIGTGSGYQAAVLGELGSEVFTIEIVSELAASATALLGELGYDRVHVRHGDGYLGWPDEAPFDKVIVTAAPAEIPAALVEQLRTGGRMVLPVGPQGGVQQLVLLRKTDEGEVRQEHVIQVRFVPMVRQ